MNTSRPLLLTCSLASLLLLSVAALLGSDRSEPALADSTTNAAQTRPLAEPTQASTRRDVARIAGYTAAPGTALAYDLHLELGLGLANRSTEAAEQATPNVVVQASGSLRLVVLGRRDDEVLVGYRTQGVAFAVRGSTDQATAAWSQVLQRTLQQGFDVRMDARGRPVAMRFLGEWTGEQRNFARAFVGAFRCEFQGSGSWSTSYEDTMGRHTFEHRAEANGDDVSIRRTRTGFVPKGAEGDAKALVQMHGAADATFAANVEWLSTASVEDTLAWSWLEGALRVSSSLRGTLRWTRSDAVAVQADWQGPFVDVIGANEVPASTEDPMRHFWDEKLRGLDVTAVLQRLQTFLDSKQEPSQEYQELLQMLAELVRRDPNEADRLVGLVRSARITGQAAADVLAALGMAGHERAQLALTVVFENGLVESGLRRAAVESMFQLEHPRQELVDSLRRSVNGAQQLDALAGSAMLAMGALGTRGAVTSEGCALVLELLGLESAARRDGLEDAWYEALGNTGDPAVLPLAQRLSGSNDAAERARAVTVLRRVTSPAAAAMLQSIARGDADAEVRRQALQTIGETTAGWTRDVLVERASADSDAEVRRVAYSALASRARTDTVAHSALVQRLAAETDPDLRQMLQSLLRGA